MNVKSARKAAEFVHCCESDDKGRMICAVVPGHDAKLYKVRFTRQNGKILAHDCAHESLLTGRNVCKGHKFGFCFHALAALIYAADKKGMRLTFCATHEKADRISRTGGTIVQISSANSGRLAWAVYRKKKSFATKTA